MAELETSFPATLQASREVRVALRDALHTWQLDGFGDLVELLASELVTNVVRHVGGPGTMRATRAGSRLRVEVGDASAEPPVVRRPGPTDTHGRGILLVDALAAQWGVSFHPGGKTVWFELDVDEANREVRSDAAGLEESGDEEWRSTTGLRFALEAGRIGTWSWNPSNGRVVWDDSMARLFGRTLEDFEGTFERFVECLEPEDRVWIAHEATAACEAATDLAFEHRVRWPDGTLHWIEARGRAVLDASGRPLEMIGIGIDIDDRKRLQLAVDEAARTRADAEARRLDEQRNAVSVLNEVLIRPLFPSVPGYEFDGRYLPGDEATGIGGDWYDAFLLPDGRIMAAVGDITGHGVPAARLMAKLRHATRAYACQSGDPVDILAELDGFVRHFAIEEQYATMQLAVLDPGSGLVRVASAGHPPPLVLTPSGATFHDVEGRLLGIHAPGFDVAAHALVLHPGEALVLYTDGLVERRAESIELGFARLRDSLRSSFVARGARALLDVVLAGCLDPAVRSDDVCVLAIVRQGAPADGTPSQQLATSTIDGA